MPLSTLDELYSALMSDLPPVIRANLALEATVALIKAKTDLLDVSRVNVVSPVSGSTITIVRGDTLSAAISGLGDLTGYVSLDFSVKRATGELDASAIIHIRKNVSGVEDGLLRLNGAEYATATDGAIAITDETAGDIGITLKSAATSALAPGSYVYDLQLITAGGVSTLTGGALTVIADVTRMVG